MQTIYRLEWFVGLILLQVLVFNHIHLGEYATPFVYIYYLLALEADTSRVKLLLWGFTLGMCVDIFGNTPGMNASAATMLALARTPLLRSQTMRDSSDNFVPSIRAMGVTPFLRYTLSCAFVHSLTLQLIDAFSLFRPVPLLQRTVGDTLLTALCMFCLDFIRRTP